MPLKVPPSTEEQTAVAAYIADLTGALAKMARRHQLVMLGYLLDMAKLEAENTKGADSNRT